METIGERIRVLRKNRKLNQTDFGKRIGLKQTAIGMYENNQSTVTTQSISLICQAFNVRREWLEKGEGEMFLPMSRADAVMAWAERISKEPNGFPHQFAAALVQLDVSDWQVLERLARALAAASPQAPASAEPPASAGEDAATLEEPSTVAGDELDADPAAAFAQLRPDVQHELMRLAPAVKREKTREALTGTSLLSACAVAGEA